MLTQKTVGRLVLLLNSLFLEDDENLPLVSKSDYSRLLYERGVPYVFLQRIKSEHDWQPQEVLPHLYDGRLVANAATHQQPTERDIKTGRQLLLIFAAVAVEQALSMSEHLDAVKAFTEDVVASLQADGFSYVDGNFMGGDSTAESLAASPVEEDTHRKISEITRRDILDAVLLDEQPFYGRMDLMSFLKRVWPLKSMPSTDHRFKDAEGDIWQHMVNNSDWSDSELLTNRLSLLEIPDGQFARFLETCVHPLSSPDSERTQKLVGTFNDLLQPDGFELRPSGEISGRKLWKLSSTQGATTLAKVYEVVLSFAGEDRDYVDQVAKLLKNANVSLFYDNYEEAALWGKNLVEHLQKVYSGSARFCVMFISKHYAEKVWPTHERRSAFEKAIELKEEYILPARFDDTEIPGLHKTIHYVDLRKKTPDQLAALILAKLGR